MSFEVWLFYLKILEIVWIERFVVFIFECFLIDYFVKKLKEYFECVVWDVSFF